MGTNSYKIPRKQHILDKHMPRKRKVRQDNRMQCKMATVPITIKFNRIPHQRKNQPIIKKKCDKTINPNDEH